MSVPAVASAVKIYLAQYDVSGSTNKVAVTETFKELNATVFGNAAENVEGGIPKVALTGSGLLDYGTTAVHTALHGNIGVRDVPVTISPESGAVGNVASLFKAMVGSYQVGAPVGDLLPFTVSASGQGRRLAHGKIFVAADAKVATGVSTIYQLGLIGAGKKLCAALHVLSITADDTLDVTVKSDALEAFGSPTTRLTFTTATTVTSEWKELAGAIADDEWFRVDYTIGVADPSISFVVAVGIV